MTHPLVDQLYFARKELLRSLDGLTDEDARRRFKPMNCISWMIGHLANQENFYWVRMGQGQRLQPDLWRLVGTGQPASTPPLDEMWQAWHVITVASQPFLNQLTTDSLTDHLRWRDAPWGESIGTCLQRTIYHYWFHIGEAQAVRQLLGHTALPQFVGDMSTAAFRPN